jgi:hypothetical protein
VFHWFQDTDDRVSSNAHSQTSDEETTENTSPEPPDDASTEYTSSEYFEEYSQNTSILRTCRQIYNNAAPLLAPNILLNFASTAIMLDTLSNLPSSVIKSLRTSASNRIPFQYTAICSEALAKFYIGQYNKGFTKCLDFSKIIRGTDILRKAKESISSKYSIRSI